MTKKQKKMLGRILISAVLFVVLRVLSVPGLLGLVLYLIPYGIIGYDVLRRAASIALPPLCFHLVSFALIRV